MLWNELTCEYSGVVLIFVRGGILLVVMFIVISSGFRVLWGESVIINLHCIVLSSLFFVKSVFLSSI